MNEYTFEELPIGKREVLLVSVAESDIDRFADFSGDSSTIHMDDDYAAGRGFRSRLGHGVLVASYISALLGMKLPGKHGLLQSINCQFRAPCYAPNVLTITGTVTRRSEAIKVVTLQIDVVDQGGTLIVQADAKSFLKL
jgi:3-hydroxybutyryl-CoA dehydratase